MIHYCKKFGTKLDDLDVPGKLQNAAKSYLNLGLGSGEFEVGLGANCSWAQLGILYGQNLPRILVFILCK